MYEARHPKVSALWPPGGVGSGGRWEQGSGGRGHMYACGQFMLMHGRGHHSSVQFSRSVTSVSLQPHGLQHTRLPCPLPTPRACSDSCPSSQWCHPTISSSVISFSSCPQSFPASGSFPSQLFSSGGQSIGVSASISALPMTPRTDLL